MDETFGNASQPRNISTQPSQLVQTLSWIHAERDAGDLLAIMQQVARDVETGLTPQIEARFNGDFFSAAAYFRLLAGNVATLGGVRAQRGAERQCVQLVHELERRLSASGVRQIQAVLPIDDTTSQHLMRRAGFAPLTRVQQLVLAVTPSSFQSMSSSESLPLKSEVSWTPASLQSERELEELIDATFIDTLDCPLINNVRTPHDVLLGFLDHKELRARDDWFVGQVDGVDAGVLFMNQSNAEVAELVYMGIRPEFRRQGLGVEFLRHATGWASNASCDYLALGVDEMNWPAIQLYQQAGFQLHQTMSVYFNERDIQRMRKAA